MRTTLMLATLAVAVLAGCESQSDADTRTIPLPDRTLHSETLDTVVWTDSTAMLARGKEVFGWACARCHGPTGQGDGGEVTVNGDTLRPPSFHTADWRFAKDPHALAVQIYQGNEKGMPHWGADGIQPRDVIAIAAYIEKDLRAGQ